jgi:chromosome segregation ATPase
MAKKPKDKPRSQKLKVFRTAIGFHDAYVAAPSQKAALEAWGADGNLFAQGIAEQVTDEKLMEEPLARPGEVIKRLRGSHEEHIAALGAEAPRSKAQATKKDAPRPKPKPSRDELDAAEQALENAGKKQRKALAKFDEQIRQLERERRDLQRKQERDRDRLAQEVERARSAYQNAMQEWGG